MNDYTYQDMMRMQSEAKQRVLEMQKRSRNAAESFNGAQKGYDRQAEENTQELPRIPKKISYPAELNPNQYKQQKSSFRQGIDIRSALKSAFGNLSGEEYEKMFILSLCLLLTKDGADESLIMALMYLLA
jgi:hypothetical protein